MEGWSTDLGGATAGAGNSVTTTTATADVLTFGQGARGLGAGFITVRTVNAGGLNFDSSSGAIDLSGGTINLAAASTITVNNASSSISWVLAGAGTSLPLSPFPVPSMTPPAKSKFLSVKLAEMRSLAPKEMKTLLPQETKK